GAAPLVLAEHAVVAVTAPATWTAAAVATLCLFLGGMLTPRRPRSGRVATSLGLLMTLALAAPLLGGRPVRALVVLMAATTALAMLWRVGGSLLSGFLRREPLHAGQARGAALGALMLWLLATLGGSVHGPIESGVAAFAMLVALFLTWQWTVLARKNCPRRSLLLRALTIAGMAWAGFAMTAPPYWGAVGALAVPVGAAAAMIRRPPRFAAERASWWEPMLGHPERLFVGTFAALCLLGTVLLALPAAASSGTGIGFLDSLFTAVSAVCVTGLIVRDTPVDFTAFGQAILLALIQVGGLGIMTFSTAALRVLGRRMSLRTEGAAASLISTRDRGQLAGTAKRILLVTVACEAAGAAILFAAFLARGEGAAPALWRAAFTSVSAFCNAGFALQSDSLVPYAHSPEILHVVAALIVIGGVSPAVLAFAPRLLRRRTGPVPVQAVLAVATTGVLLVTGTALYLAFEWTHTLSGLPFLDRLHNAWFQSVTLRTAGFSSLDLAAAQPATLTFLMIWMLIGGSPGGTAGGIKTTTAALLVLSVVQAVRGRAQLIVFGRQVSELSRARAGIVVTMALTSLILGVTALQLTQAMPTREILFEVVSALGTVGLSIGGTEHLDGIGKIVITGCMFTGRVGGVTLLMFLSQRRTPPALGRPEEEIDVG
ncbi:potassium transporter TrkH, partial [bacterium]|nr:potassium transporter TrkH [bacterium]